MYVPSLYEVSIKRTGRSHLCPDKEGVRHKDYKGNRDGSRQCAVSGETGGSVYPCDTGSCRFGNSARLYPRLSFCQAGQLYRPVREKSLETLKHYATTMLDGTVRKKFP